MRSSDNEAREVVQPLLMGTSLSGLICRIDAAPVLKTARICTAEASMDLNPDDSGLHHFSGLGLALRRRTLASTGLQALATSVKGSNSRLFPISASGLGRSAKT